MRATIIQSLIFISVLTGSCSGEQPKGKTTADAGKTEQLSVPVDSIAKAPEKPMTELERHDASFVLENYIVPKIPNKDFTEITSERVIFYQPEAKEIKAYKKEFGEEHFYAVSDDNVYYAYEAEIFLEQKGIKSVYPDTRYLKFKLSNGETILFDAKADAHLYWTTILFTPGKAPRIINPVDVEQECKAYFGK